MVTPLNKICQNCYLYLTLISSYNRGKDSRGGEAVPKRSVGM